MNTEKQTKKGRLFLRLLWLVPLVAVAYIGYMNILPFGGTDTYVIDFGAQDTSGKAKLVGPFDRISDKLVLDSWSSRELEKHKVYFEIEDPRLGIADQIEVQVRFKDHFPDNGSLRVGARATADGDYDFNDTYIPLYDRLADLSLVTEDDNIRVYATQDEDQISYRTVQEFLQNPPLGSVIATNDTKLNVNQMISPAEIGGIDLGGLERVAAFPTLLVDESTENGPFETDTSLRGHHTFYFFNDSRDTPLELTITKRDLNLYDGEDILEVSIQSLDGQVIATEIIPDDGDATKSKGLGPTQNSELSIENFEEGTYLLTIKPLNSDADFVVTHLGLNEAKLVAKNKVFLAGGLYLDDDALPTTIWCYLFSEGNIEFRTSHQTALQSIQISGNGQSQTIDVDAVKTPFSTGPLKPGIYQITAEKGDIIIDTPSGYLSFTENSIFLPVSSTSREQNGSLITKSILRGGHTFWTYVTNDSLDIQVTKQDLNFSDGPDELVIKVFSSDNKLQGSFVIADDGDESGGKQLGREQVWPLTIQDLESGAYRIELRGGQDLLIAGVEINQTKLVVEKAVYLTGMNPLYFRDIGLVHDPVSIYGKNFSESNLSLYTSHKNGLQNTIISNEDTETEINVGEVGVQFNTTLKPGDFRVTVPRQDIIVGIGGYFSFTADSFFLPKRCEVLDLEYDLSWAMDNSDYVIINRQDYERPAEDDGWLVAHATWKAEDLFIDDNTLSFCLSVPHLSNVEDQEDTIPVDWVSVRVKTLPVWERM